MAPSSDSNPSKAQRFSLDRIRQNLKLSYEERAIQHQKLIECMDELKKIGKANRAKTTQISDS